MFVTSKEFFKLSDTSITQTKENDGQSNDNRIPNHLISRVSSNPKTHPKNFDKSRSDRRDKNCRKQNDIQNRRLRNRHKKIPQRTLPSMAKSVDDYNNNPIHFICHPRRATMTIQKWEHNIKQAQKMGDSTIKTIYIQLCESHIKRLTTIQKMKEGAK